MYLTKYKVDIHSIFHPIISLHDHGISSFNIKLALKVPETANLSSLSL